MSILHNKITKVTFHTLLHKGLKVLAEYLPSILKITSTFAMTLNNLLYNNCNPFIHTLCVDPMCGPTDEKLIYNLSEYKM